jgi:N-acetylglutamate synthase-like GNAT family acetyltransferase
VTTRILPREEWPRLVGTEAETVWPQLTDAARVVVVEHDGAIVGCHLLQPVLHAECLWIHPDYRKRASVARRLWAAVQQAARQHFQARWFATGAASDEVRALLAHVGAVRVDGDHYMVPVGGD